MSDRIKESELLAYRVEVRNSIFRQIHQRLRELREHGWTQKKLAARLDMDEGQFSKCLRGDTDLRLETLSDLARALGFRISATLVPLDMATSRTIFAEADYIGDPSFNIPAIETASNTESAEPLNNSVVANGA